MRNRTDQSGRISYYLSFAHTAKELSQRPYKPKARFHDYILLRNLIARLEIISHRYGISKRVISLRRKIQYPFKWVFWSTFHYIFRRRRILLPISRRAGNLIWAVLTPARVNALLAFALHTHQRWPLFVSRFIFWIYEYAMTFMMSVHLAGRQSGRAYLAARYSGILFRYKLNTNESLLRQTYLTTLLHCARFHRIAASVAGKECLDNANLNQIIGIGHLYDLNLPLAKYYFRRAIEVQQIPEASYSSHRFLGRVYLLEGDLKHAKKHFNKSVSLRPNTVMAHQNYAGRYDIDRYRPKRWELRRAGKLLVYDNFGQLAEDLFLQGKFKESLCVYQRLLDYQKSITRPLPKKLIAHLQQKYSRFDPKLPVRLLPYEWVVQFGHIGLLDSYMKMAKLGMYPKANYVVLAPEDKVVAPEYLAYWDEYFIIVRNKKLVDKLFPYQRYCGDSFQAYAGNGEIVEHWTRAAARAQTEWAEQRRPALLRLSERDRTLGEDWLRALGIPEGAWYVGLHVRESGYHSESPDGMSRHRNARLADYLPAIREITSRGGWVVRLGDPSMQPIPEMENVVDYACNRNKSPRLDLFLLATSRFVIGTTSGLTTVCLSFGTPMVLVNCISNDWQLWTGETDFIPKPIWDRSERRYLSFREAYRQPVQGYLINSEIMHRHMYEAHANDEEDIRQAVRYKLDLCDGTATRPNANDPLMRAYRKSLSHNPHIFGAASPVPAFLQRHPKLVELSETQRTSARLPA